MHITINGTQQETTATTLAELLALLSVDTTQAAVERNLEIVPSSLYAQTPLSAGDVIEIVEFIGGG